MKRIKLKDRKLPEYTKGEEILNTLTHILGALFAIFALVSCLIISVKAHNRYGVVSSLIYGISMIILYSMSSMYHGISSKFQTAKKIFQIIDHCVIFLFIAGTYTPILLISIRKYSPLWAWILFSVVWGVTVIGIVLNSIDLHYFKKISMILYLAMGWAIVARYDLIPQSLSKNGIILLVSGGLSYTIGTVFYGLQKKHKYMHGIWHLFILLGSLLHYLCIIKYVLIF